MKILGIDPSTTSMGLAFPNQSTYRVKPPSSAGTGVERLQWLRDQIRKVIEEGRPDLVVLEDYILGTKQFGAGTVTTAEWGGVLRLLLLDYWIPVAMVNPSTLKSYLQIKKGEDKTAGYSRLAALTGRIWGTNDEAEAWALASMGYCHFGTPWFKPTKEQAAAVARIEWPTLIL